MKLGPNGEALIKSFEQLRLVSYQDERGIWTAGWGHVRGVQPLTTYTEQQAESWFIGDTLEAVNGVTRCLDIAVNQNEFDALVSFAFNCGVAALAHSTLLRDLNEGDRQSAANEFLKWDYAGGHVSDGLERRRKAERALFLTPIGVAT